MTPDAEREPFVDAVAAGDFLHLRPRQVLEMARRGEIPAYCRDGLAAGESQKTN